MDASRTVVDPLSVEAFTAPGAPFELIETQLRGAKCRTFRNAPRCLADLYRAARVHDAKVCAVMDGAHLTYGELFGQAAMLAAHLRALGVEKGTHVAIAMRNRPQWLVAFVAISSLGAVPVLANSRSAAVELAGSLAYAQCRHVIADTQCAALLAEGQFRGAAGIVAGEAPAEGAIHWESLASIIAAAAAVDLPLTVCAADDPALIMFTSGTTGTAKGAVLDQVGVLTALMANQLSAALLGARMAKQMGVDLATLARQAPQPCTLLVFPLFHTSGCLSVFLTTLARGGKIVFLPRWSAAEALRLVQEERVQALPAVPTMLWDILQFPGLAAFDTSSLVSLGSGGQGMPGNLLAAIQARFPRALLGTGYGMTETNGMVSLAVGAEFLAHPHTAGRPLATAEIRIVDDAGGELPAGEAGEISVRSAQNMSGYWAQPQADALIFRNGWLHTGDVGFIDREGFLNIVARKTDMIISGGENIYCAEVERVLNQHPDVIEVATFGLPDERLGEKLVAAIVPRAGVRPDAAQLRAFCGERLAEYKLPREWRFSSEPLERNAAGKIMKGQVRLRLAGGLSMPFPRDAKIVDLMLAIPVSETNQEWYEQFKPLLMDEESREQFKMPAQYLFKDIPKLAGTADYVRFLVGEMNRYSIDVALVGCDEGSEAAVAARRDYPQRFIFDYPANPNRGMDEIRRIRRRHSQFRLHSVSVFPCGLNPQVPINDKKMYPLYATCVELGLPILVNVGVPGPRVPMEAQKVEHVDEVCWFFPELKFVMRHGAEPWEDLAVKLMLKYPNLYYSTSAFAPKHYPRAIIDYANTRGAHKIMYAGYFPMGLSLERIFRELPEVPFKDEVWPLFLSGNARRVFGIGAATTGEKFMSDVPVVAGANAAATRAHLAGLKGEELLRWRTAPLSPRPSAQERGIDLPLPFGWFVVCYSDGLEVGQVKSVRYFGRDLALWRGADGQARMLDAYCRHLGAHMGFGGRVHGNLLECPFHAWRYDGMGTVQEIPYSKVIPPRARRECVRHWPTAEKNRMVWAWYHPDALEPQWEVEEFPETASAEWTDYERHEWLVHCPLQTMAENGVDVAHFRYVHGTASYPDWQVRMEGHRRETSVSAKMETPRGAVDGTITAGVVGPGQPWTRFTGICETLLVTGCTPVEIDTVHLRFAFTQQCADRDGPRAGVARAIIRDICRQLDQDKVVWDRQRHVEQPLLCEGDGPIAAFRKFFSQFYAELHRESGPAVVAAQHLERKARV